MGRRRSYSSSSDDSVKRRYRAEKREKQRRYADDQRSSRRRRRSYSSSSRSSAEIKVSNRRRERKLDDNSQKKKDPKEKTKTNEEAVVNILLGRTGGAYIPPAKLRAMQAKITDKTSEPYQRIAWEALKKSIHGYINRVNVSNLSEIVKKILSENVVRGRGLFARSILLAQAASPTFTHVFAALVAVLNTRLPQRLISEFRKAFRRNQKDRCLTDASFLSHLVNQKVVHELIVLELLTLLLEQTTNDSVEVAVAVLKECGLYLSTVVPRGLRGVFEHLRRILNEGECDKRVSYMLEVMFQIQKDGWKDHPTIIESLDLIDEDDQITHTLSLLDDVDPEDKLNVFKFDPNFETNEEKYVQIRQNFLASDNEEEEASSNSSDSSSEESESSDEEQNKTATATSKKSGEDTQQIIDCTETNLVHLRRTIYLLLQSSLSADEGAHRLLLLKIRPGEEYEVASMVLDCCAQTRSYESRYGNLGQRLCAVKVYHQQPNDTKGAPQSYMGKPPSGPPKNDFTGPSISYKEQFERIFVEQYQTIHRLETPKLQNIAMFYAHLLFKDSISWAVLQCVKLNERDTTSSGRIFIKHMLLEMCSSMNIAKMQERFRDETIQPYLAGLLPRNNPKDTRFAINFLTVIGLGGLTMDLRNFLEQVKEGKIFIPPEPKVVQSSESSSSSSSESSSSSSDSSSSSSSSSESSSESSSSSSSSSSDESVKRKKKKKKAVPKSPVPNVKKEQDDTLRGRNPDRPDNAKKSRADKGRSERKRDYSSSRKDKRYDKDIEDRALRVH